MMRSFPPAEYAKDARFPAGGAAFTILLWLQTTDDSASDGLCNWGTVVGGGGFTFVMESGVLYGNNFAAQTSGTPPVNDGSLHKCALVYDGANPGSGGGNVSIYVDGALASGPDPLDCSGLTPGGIVKLGDYLGGSQIYTGTLGNVGVWTAALDGTALSSSADPWSDFGGLDSCVSFWPLADGSLKDSTPYRNNLSPSLANRRRRMLLGV
jgi:hypothetical protein